MFPLPNSVFEGVRFPAVPQTQAAVLLAIQQQLAVSQYWPAAEMRARQFEQIEELISHIDRCVPHYGVSLRKAGVRPGQPITEEIWRRVPVLTRRAAQDANDRLFATQTPQSHGQVGDYTTSGTSGMPVRLKQTKLHHLFWQSFVLREEIWHRRDLGATILGIRRDDERREFSGAVHIRGMPDWGAPVSTVYSTGPSLVLDYRATVADQAEVVRRERPAYLVVHPSMLVELLRHCREHDVSFEGLRGVRTVLEVLAPEVRQLCHEVLEVGITDIYSCGEAGYLAIQCPEHGAYHLQQENALIEILDDAGAPCAPGAIGRVVITPLHNFAMPLLRYEVGDLAEMGELCPCGRNLPVIARIVGRGRDMLTLPDGAKRYPFYGHRAMMNVRAIRQHQLVQKSLTQIEIRLVVAHPLSAAEEATIREAAIAGLGHPFEITFTYTEEIKREASGKYAEFRSEIAAADTPRSPG